LGALAAALAANFVMQAQDSYFNRSMKVCFAR
jgi:hypothetical protein